jgi:recombination protein RecA
MADLVTVAVAFEVIEKSGSWLSYGENRLGQGKDKAADLLREQPQLAQEIREKVLAQTGKMPIAVADDDKEEAAAEA